MKREGRVAAFAADRNEEKRSEVRSVRHVETPLKVLFITARRINWLIRARFSADLWVFVITH